MASKREQALSALLDRLKAVTGATVLRNEALPERVPAGGLIVLRDGDPGAPEAVLSPLAYHFRHGAEIEAYVQAAPAASRDAAMDDLLVAIGAAVAIDRTLGGAVDYVEMGAPELSEEAVEGAAAIKRASVTAWLHYASSDPLL